MILKNMHDACKILQDIFDRVLPPLSKPSTTSCICILVPYGRRSR